MRPDEEVIMTDEKKAAESPEAPKKRTVFSWFGLIGLLVFIGLLAAAYFVWNRSAEKELERTIAGIKSRGKPTTLEEIVPEQIPDADNAALLYEEVFRLNKE